MSFRLIIKPLRTGTDAPAEFELDVDESVTVEELKEQIASRVTLPKENIRLVCAGRIWDNPATVASYGVTHRAVVHCLNNPPRSQPTSAQQTLTEVDPMAQMMGMGAGAAIPEPTSNDPMEQMMAQAQRQVMQNPEMMNALLNSPMVQSMMSNPETVRSMMRMNPRMNQLMEQRPEIARMLEDPEVIQQSLRMMQNPSLMREMMRNSDVALGRLDAMPGGHSALRQAHEDYADPLFAAMVGSEEAGGGSNAVNTYEQSTQGAPNSQPLANPWGAPAAPTPAPTATAPFSPLQQPAGEGAPLAPGANPMHAMMQMFQQQQAPAAQGEHAAAAPPAPALNPLTALLQPPSGVAQPGATAPLAAPGALPAASPLLAMMQLMQPPAAGATPAAPAAPAQPAANPFFPAPPQPGTNPFLAMMQQMMANPEAMQQAAQLSQMMMAGGAGGLGTMQAGGLGGVPATPAAPAAPFTPAVPTLPAATTSPAAPMVPNPYANMVEASQRARFAFQVSQLAAMGFTNEAVCLRVLAQHNGRLDAAIDALLSAPDAMTPGS